MLLLHYGKWDCWGFEISYLHEERYLAISFIHWYVALEWRRN